MLFLCYSTHVSVVYEPIMLSTRQPLVHHTIIFQDISNHYHNHSIQHKPESNQNTAETMLTYDVRYLRLHIDALRCIHIPRVSQTPSSSKHNFTHLMSVLPQPLQKHGLFSQISNSIHLRQSNSGQPLHVTSIARRAASSSWRTLSRNSSVARS